MLKRCLALTMCILLIVSCSSNEKGNDQGEQSSALDIDVEKRVLDNGLKVLIVKNSSLPIFSLYTFYDVGGRFEGEGTTGATHFLEHMLFRKTKNYPSGYFSNFVDSNGGSSNAYTTFDNTVYYEKLPIENLGKTLELEAERMSNVVLDPEEFEKERGAVLEERKMRYENSPRGKMYSAMMKTMFEGTPYGGSVIGAKEDVLNLSREKMLDFYKDFYAPNNATVVLVGDVESDNAFDMIEETLGKLKKNEKLKSIKEKYSKNKSYDSKAKLPKVIGLRGQSPTPMFSLSFPAPKVGNDEAYALDFLSSILGDGVSSYLNQEFVTGRRPKLTNVYAANYTLKNSGVFFIQGQLLDRVSIRGFRKKLFRSLKKACDKAIDERSLKKTQNNVLLSYYSNITNNSGLASFLGQNEFFHGDYAWYKNELEIYNNMTVKKVKDVCKKYLDPKKSAFISIWNKHKRTKL
ncbi:MAG: pitrilysin family protein [Bdellovibrionota bacterium]|nr:pitrilysin family protein [Bdellovibrionota bacterium]